MITRADIEKNQPVVIKWDKPLVGDNGVTDGVMAGQASEFIPRIEEEAKFLSLCRYIEMEGETQDIQTLRVKANLQNMNKLTGDYKGAQVDKLSDLDETLPDILKKTLTAQPFTAFTTIGKTFLKTNIEKEGFISSYEALLAPACAYSAEQIAFFGKIPKTGQTSAGLEALNGLFAQLDAVRANYDEKHETIPQVPMGKYDTIDLTNPILPQIDAMLRQFRKQKGKRTQATIFVSSTIEALMIEEASERETNKGDALFFNDDGNLVFRGREVIVLDALDDPANDWESTEEIDAEFVLIANPDSIAYGPVMEAESEAEYKIELKKYLTSIDWMFDIGVIFPQDVLYATTIPSE